MPYRILIIALNFQLMIISSGLMLISTSSMSRAAQYNIKTINFLELAKLDYNGIGPVLVKADTVHNRIIIANTLSSSISVYDCSEKKVINIPTGKRALQHLKNEALTYSRSTGDIYLVADHSLIVTDVKNRKAKTIETEKQFEAVTVDEQTGNAFIVGRESKDIGFYDAKEGKLKMLKWLEMEEKLINMNQTPPPPIRKVVFLNPTQDTPSGTQSRVGKLIAIDGYTGKMDIYDGKSLKKIKSRELKLSKGGRWHLAGVNEKYGYIYLVTETAKRKVDQASKIDVDGESDVIIQMPDGFTEPAGITYNPMNDKVFIPYDNHPSVHQVGFSELGVGSEDLGTKESGGDTKSNVFEIAIPTFGNDASAIDPKNQLLFIGSWAKGEVYVINMKTGRFIMTYSDLGIIPHMFAMTFNHINGRLYYPLGASAVNGTFGAAITELDPMTKLRQKIYTGWAPVDLIELPNQRSFMVFNNEDKFAVIYPEENTVDENALPFDFPICSSYGPNNAIYLSYGPHQSYWPVVYIWGAKNGILTIDPGTYATYDRRIPRQAMKLALGANGKLYATQNNWGKEPQFVNVIEDGIRYNDIGKRIVCPDSVERENTQRVMQYDRNTNMLYLVRVAESDDKPSVLTIINADSNKVVKNIEVGLNATDLAFDVNNFFISNFLSNDITIINKNSFNKKTLPCDKEPLKLLLKDGKLYVINHGSNTMQMSSVVTTDGTAPVIKSFKLTSSGLPDNIFEWKNKIIITSHSSTECTITAFEPASEKFETIYKDTYPFGDSRFDGLNSSFYMTGQFGDAVFSITQCRTDVEGKLWIADFLSGRCYVIN